MNLSHRQLGETMPKLIVKDIKKSFFDEHGSQTVETKVLDGVSFSVESGEFITFFGPNGCGKTTLLNIIAGIVKHDSGEVNIDGKSPSEAKMGYIFQNYVESLFPWARVIDNIALPLKLDGIGHCERHKRAQELLKQLSISVPLRSYPYQLSGGQKQLVAIARALLFSPDLLVMDEPFSALDHETRFSMQNRIQELWRNQLLTILFVSHEIDEAIYLADRLILLTKRPARIRKVFEIPLPRPRTHQILETEDFFHLKAAVLREFRGLMAE
jgi:NitT/TauT family transport system ATP-binding protein